MPWLQFSLEAEDGDTDRLSELFELAGALSVTLQDAEDQPIYEPDPGDTPLWSRTRVVALFGNDVDPERIFFLLAGAEPDWAAALHVARLDDRDWEREWLRDFRPMQYGRRLWVCPTSEEPPDPKGVNLFMDPGLAFGTGTHPTTALCLEWLDACPPKDREVLDFGCGSGILAIAALRLGAGHATAVDIDPQALQACAENAARNGVSDRIDIMLPGDLPAGTVDVLLANILANPLIDLAENLAARVRPGGTIVLSGILEEQGEAVAAAYHPWFNLLSSVVREGWVRLKGVRCGG